jgi:hypothetical protein
MGKLLMCVLALSLLSGTAAISQSSLQQESQAAAATAPEKSIKGTAKVKGDKVTFISDKNQKSWDVLDPEALLDHDGHHVQVRANIFADKGAIRVISVKMLNPLK